MVPGPQCRKEEVRLVAPPPRFRGGAVTLYLSFGL